MRIGTESGNVSPCLARDDIRNVTWVNIILGREACLANSARRISLTDGSNVVGGELCAAMSFTNRRLGSALLMSIARVLCVCSQPKMRRIAAGRIVASVGYTEFVRKGAVSKQVRDSMRNVSAPLDANDPIAALVTASTPGPASIGRPVLDFGPKPRNLLRGEVREDTMFLRHDVLHNRALCSERRRSSTTARRSFYGSSPSNYYKSHLEK